jgi:iron complex outermembrane receptor protein
VNNRTQFVPIALTAIAALLNWSDSSAQTATSSSTGDQLATIVVTAEKREEALANVPMSVTALSGSTLDALQAREFSDYAALVPGLSLQTSQAGETRLTLRGENAGGVGSTVAVYVDESPFGSSSALLNGSILSGDFDTWDLQRVEVLRGPQGTLYGSNSEGGLLKFVTTAPVLGSFSGAAEVTGEGVDHGGKGGDVRAVLNLPLGDKLAFRISGFDQDVPGYVNDPLSGKNDVNDGHKEGGRASLLAAPTDDLSIRLTATSQQSKYDGIDAIDVDPVTLRPVHGDLTQERFIGEPSSFMYESYGILNSDTFSDASNELLAPGLTVAGLLGEAIAPNLGAYLDDLTDMNKFTQEIRLSSPASDQLEWQVGGYFTRESGAIIEHLNAMQIPGGAPVPGLTSLEIPIIASTYKESAGFGSVTYHFIPEFDLQAGGRYSSNKQTDAESVTGLLVQPQILNSPSSGHVFTYSVAPRWHVDANTMVYARIATGYRPGGPNALPPLAPPDVPREYGADKTTNAELGIRSTQLDGRLSIDVAAFHVDWKDIQLTELLGSFNFNGNGGTARSQGLEWTFGYIPVHGLTFSWTGAYTDAHLTSDAPGVSGHSGDPLPYAPKWGTSLDGAYDWAAFADYKGFVGATWSYVGARRSDFASSVDENAQVPLPSYNTIALRTGVENDRYRVTLWGKNLADKRGITSYQSSGAPGFAGEITVIDPRTVGVTLSAKF